MPNLSSRILLLPALAVAVATAQTGRPRITTEAELPRFSYPVHGTIQQLVEGPKQDFLAFATPVRRDIDKLLASYDIEDHATLRRLLQAELNLDLVEGRDGDALALVPRLRSLEDKPAEKLTDALEEEAWARTHAGASATGCPAGYAAALNASLTPLPWAQVASGVQELRNFSQIATPQLFVGFAESSAGPTVAKQGAVALTDATLIIRARAAILVQAGCSGPTFATLNSYVQAHNQAKPDIWAARDITFPPNAHLTPVNVAIWDSGIDTSLFPGQLYTNPAPPPSEDPHGIAFDVHALPTHGELIPLTPSQKAQYPSMVNLMQGLGDYQNSVDSPAAGEFRAHLAQLSPPQVREFLDLLDALGSYAHGTHVAGIAARGNPAIRMAYARITYDTNNPHLPPSEADQHQLAASYAADLAWFRSHGIRVVNMSWWNRPSNYEKDLADNGIGASDAERKQLARRYFQIERDALFQAIQSAPEILFVTIAGNNDANNAFEECIPSSFVLPNLIVTGAVDQAGDETDFTSYGDNVLVDANGRAVPSVVPGGATVRDTGTSMAAPQVTNLATKLLAVDPALTPVQLIALIRDGATASDDGRRHLIDPARSLALLQGKASAGSPTR